MAELVYRLLVEIEIAFHLSSEVELHAGRLRGLSAHLLPQFVIAKQLRDSRCHRFGTAGRREEVRRSRYLL